MFRLSPFLLPLCLTACDDTLLVQPEEADAAPALRCVPGFVPGEDGCVFSEEAVQATLRSFDGGALVKVNREPFYQAYGSNFARNVWITELPVELDDGEVITTVELYAMIDPERPDQALPGRFPIGTMIVHETVHREEGHTVQVKLADRADDMVDSPPDWIELTDPVRPHWYTGKFFDDGVADEDPCTPCTTCHNDDVRPDTEGLIGAPAEVL